MASSGSNHRFSIQKETTAGSLPSPFTPKTLRILEGSGLEQNQSALVSNELTGSSRQTLSSTLGTPNPQWSGVGVEYSFGSFDQLFEGAFQNTWVGNGILESATIDVAATTLTTDDGSLWSSYGFADGDTISVTGFTATADNGSYLISANSATDTITLTTLSGGTPTLTVAADETLTVVGGRLSTVIDTSSNSLTVSASGLTITASSSIWLTSAIDLRYNDLIYLSGFSESANNGYFKVYSATATVLTLHEDSVLADETISSGNVEVANNTGFLTVSNEKQNFSILSGYEDIDQYRYMTGAQVSDMSMSFATDSIITGDFSFLGRYLSPFSVTSPASSVEDAETSAVFNSFRGSISIDGSAPSCLLSLDISLSNNSEGATCLFTRELDDILHGKNATTGSFSFYFDDTTLTTAYSDETPINIFVVMEDPDGNSIGVGMPKCQLQGDNFDIAETNITENMDFVALGGDTTYSNIYLINSREIPA